MDDLGEVLKPDFGERDPVRDANFRAEASRDRGPDRNMRQDDAAGLFEIGRHALEGRGAVVTLAVRDDEDDAPLVRGPFCLRYRDPGHMGRKRRPAFCLRDQSPVVRRVRDPSGRKASGPDIAPGLVQALAATLRD